MEPLKQQASFHNKNKKIDIFATRDEKALD